MSSTAVSNDTNGTSSGSSEISMPRIVRFWILLPPDIISALCTVFVLINVFVNKKSRSSVKNHVIIVLLVFGLVTQLIDIPLYLNLMLRSSVSPANPFTCLLWVFVDVGLYNGAILLMTWMAFERHIIVFHDRWLSTTKRSIIVHYIPLSAIVCYILLFYVCAYYVYPCEYEYDYTAPLCGVQTCYYDSLSLNNWDIYVNVLLPSFLEPVFTFGLIFRVVWQKYRSHQQVQWRKQRRMTIQLLSLSLPNIIINLPLNIFYLAYLCGVSPDIGADFVSYMWFFCYYITFIFPFTCLPSFLDVKKILGKIKHNHALKPTRITVTVRPEGYAAKIANHV